jgi:tRNA G46 methylase TrmB/isopentenyldiphosphate isomerase
MVCLFTVSDIVYAIEIETSATSSTLAPASEFTGDSSLKDDAAFIYLNSLINQFLGELNDMRSAGLSKRGLKSHLKKFKDTLINNFPNPSVRPDRFFYKDMYWEGETLCLPYICKEDGHKQILRYNVSGVSIAPKIATQKPIGSIIDDEVIKKLYSGRVPCKPISYKQIGEKAICAMNEGSQADTDKFKESFPEHDKIIESAVEIMNGADVQSVLYELKKIYKSNVRLPSVKRVEFMKMTQPVYDPVTHLKVPAASVIKGETLYVYLSEWRDRKGMASVMHELCERLFMPIDPTITATQREQSVIHTLSMLFETGLFHEQVTFREKDQFDDMLKTCVKSDDWSSMARILDGYKKTLWEIEHKFTTDNTADKRSVIRAKARMEYASYHASAFHRWILKKLSMCRDTVAKTDNAKAFFAEYVDRVKSKPAEIASSAYKTAFLQLARRKDVQVFSGGQQQQEIVAEKEEVLLTNPQGDPLRLDSGEDAVKTSEDIHRDGDWHMAVWAFIVDRYGRLVLWRSSAGHKNYPDALMTVVRDHVKKNESPKMAVARCVREKFGTLIDTSRLECLTNGNGIKSSFPSSERINNERVHIFFYFIDSVEMEDLLSNFSRKEAEDIWFVSLDALDYFIKSNPEIFSSTIGHIKGGELRRYYEAIRTRARQIKAGSYATKGFLVKFLPNVPDEVNKSYIRYLFNNSVIIDKTLGRLLKGRADLKKSDIKQIEVEYLSSSGTMRDVFLVRTFFTDKKLSPVEFVMKITKENQEDFETVKHETQNKVVSDKLNQEFYALAEMPDGRIVSTLPYYPGVQFEDVKDNYDAQVAVVQEATRIWRKLGHYFIFETHRLQFIVDMKSGTIPKAYLIDLGHFRMDGTKNIQISLVQQEGEMLPVSNIKELDNFKEWLVQMSTEQFLKSLVDNLQAVPPGAAYQKYKREVDEAILTGKSIPRNNYKLDPKAIIQGVINTLGNDTAARFFVLFIEGQEVPREWKQPIISALASSYPTLNKKIGEIIELRKLHLSGKVSALVTAKAAPQVPVVIKKPKMISKLRDYATRLVPLSKAAILRFEEESIANLRANPVAITGLNHKAQRTFHMLVAPSFSDELVLAGGIELVLKAAREGMFAAEDFAVDFYKMRNLYENAIGKIIYELCDNVQKVGGGIVTIRKLYTKGKLKGLEIVARDEGKGMEDVELARRYSYSESASIENHGHGFRALCDSVWFDGIDGKLIIETVSSGVGRVYCYNKHAEKFELDTKAVCGIEKGTRIQLVLNAVSSPPGSIYGVFNYLYDKGITSPEKSLTGGRIAKGLHLSYKHTLSRDIKALYYLGLIDTIDKDESGKPGRKARWFVPENVKKKLELPEIKIKLLNILSEFKGKSLRPSRKVLHTYKPRIEALTDNLRDTETDDKPKINNRDVYKNEIEPVPLGNVPEKPFQIPVIIMRRGDRPIDKLAELDELKYFEKASMAASNFIREFNMTGTDRKLETDSLVAIFIYGIQNALDSIADRFACDKTFAEGRITINLYAENGSPVIDIVDNGAGVDVDHRTAWKSQNLSRLGLVGSNGVGMKLIKYSARAINMNAYLINNAGEYGATLRITTQAPAPVFTPSSTGVVLNPGDGLFDLQAVFGNDHPVYLEIGYGNGRILREEAQKHPGYNFVGIDITILSEKSINCLGPNVRLIQAHGSYALNLNFGDDTIDEIRIIFPDPGNVRDHHPLLFDQRLFKPPFLNDVFRKLKPGGRLIVVTEIADAEKNVWQEVQKIEGFDGSFTKVPFKGDSPDSLGLDLMGSSIYRMYAEDVKKASDAYYYVIKAVKKAPAAAKPDTSSGVVGIPSILDMIKYDQVDSAITAALGDVRTGHIGQDALIEAVVRLKASSPECSANCDQFLSALEQSTNAPPAPRQSAAKPNSGGVYKNEIGPVPGGDTSEAKSVSVPENTELPKYGVGAARRDDPAFSEGDPTSANTKEKAMIDMPAWTSVFTANEREWFDYYLKKSSAQIGEERFFAIERRYHILEQYSKVYEKLKGQAKNDAVMHSLVGEYAAAVSYAAIYDKLMQEGILDSKAVRQITDLGTGYWNYSFLYAMLFNRTEKVFGLESNWEKVNIAKTTTFSTFGLDPVKFKLVMGDFFNMAQNPDVKQYYSENGRPDLVLMQSYYPNQASGNNINYEEMLSSVGNMLSEKGRIVIVFDQRDVERNDNLRIFDDLLKKTAPIYRADKRITPNGFYGMIHYVDVNVYVLDREKLVSLNSNIAQEAKPNLPKYGVGAARRNDPAFSETKMPATHKAVNSGDVYENEIGPVPSGDTSKAKSVSVPENTTKWREEIWKALEELGTKEIKRMQYFELGNFLSEKFNIPFVGLQRFIAERRGLTTKLPDHAFALHKKGYDRLMNDPEVDRDNLMDCRILGPGVYYYADAFAIFLLLGSMDKMNATPKVAVFHEFCEYLAGEEGPNDPLMMNWHGHNSVEVIIETLKFAQRVGELDGILEAYKQQFQGASKLSDYPKDLKERFGRVFKMAETGELFVSTPPAADGNIISSPTKTLFPLRNVPEPASAAGTGASTDSKTSLDTERDVVIDFRDVVIEQAQKAKDGQQKMIVALGTSWIPGYGKDSRSPYYKDLNGLIVAMRKFCQEKGIPFIDKNESELLSEINNLKSQKGFENAKVVGLVSANAVEKELAPLKDAENTFLFGVDADENNLGDDNYIRIVEMLKIAINYALNPDIPPQSPNVPVEQRGKFWIFIPKAEPIKFTDPGKSVYAVQISA